MKVNLFGIYLDYSIKKNVISKLLDKYLEADFYLSFKKYIFLPI
jgi:hypothetical protein